MLLPYAAKAGDTSYYDGKPWDVVLHAPETGVKETPYCAVRTTLWNNRRVSFELLVGPSDTKAVAVRVEKKDWNLPLNQTTTVRLQIASDIGTEIQMRAISEKELYYITPLPSPDPASFLLVTVIQTVTAARTPQPLTVIFSGNEPRWGVPGMDRFQMHELNEAYGRCDVDLRGLAVSSADNDEKGTSPFSATSPTPNPSVQSPDSSGAWVPTDWEFYTRDEDWGLTCFVQTHWGISMVGFMGSPGKDLVGFVSSVFSGETRATWHVDDKPPFVSDGAESDYFSWHEFSQLPMELLDQMAQGKELAVTGAKGERVVVSLTGASDPISKFKACFNKP